MNQRVHQVDYPYESILGLGFHSKHNDTKCAMAGNLPVLPIKLVASKARGPANIIDNSQDVVDVIDEALINFRPNMFFKQFKIKGGADRVMIYLYLFINACLKELHGQKDKEGNKRKLMNLALSQTLPIPGDANFPMNDYMEGPKNRQEEETMRSYLTQLRVETLSRLCDKVFRNDVADSQWTQFGNRKVFNRVFMYRMPVVHRPT